MMRDDKKKRQSQKDAMSKKRKYLAVCAHPDDMELRMGGTLIKLAGAGHEVKIISTTNGNAGHYDIPPEKLAERRKNEAEKAARVAGLSAYEIWDIPDGYLDVNLKTRERLIKAIREFAPDVLFTFRPWDYHPDHRAAAQLTQDASYLATVPMYCPQYPVSGRAPVLLMTYDEFASPCVFKPEIVVMIDDVLDRKIEMTACHESQFFEWLPYDRAILADVPKHRGKRLEWLRDVWLVSDRRQAGKFQELVRRRYGKTGGYTHVESFEVSEYGRKPREEEWDELLPR